MRTIELLNKIEESDSLHELARRGVISTTILFYRAIYLEYDAFLKMGNNIEQSVLLTTDKARVSRKIVYKALKQMKSE